MAAGVELMCRFGFKVIFLFVIVLGMNVFVSGRPVERLQRSAEDILAGVDFLSVFMNSAEERSYDDEITTHIPETTQSPYEDDQRTTIINEINEEKQSTTLISTDEKINNTISFVTPISENSIDKATESLHVIETNTETNQMKFAVRNKGILDELQEEDGSKVIFLVENPSAIISESKRNQFSIDESEPITVYNSRSNSRKSEVKVKRKSEDLLAIGANPDYIAQQQSRLHRDNLGTFNQPYPNRNPTSRGRSVSYSAVVQSLPPVHPMKSWKDEDESQVHHQSRSNIPITNSKDYEGHTDIDYDYTESYQDYNDNHNINKNNTKSLANNQHISSTAESKDHFVTRKYNPADFNNSADKNTNQNRPNPNADIKKSYEQHTERNWGIPEKNYEISEAEHHKPPTVYGRPEQNYEIDEAVSVMTNGRAHGVQRPSEKPLQIKVGQSPEKPDDNQKIGYVVEGRNYKKYRVEERTADGFIVGEYGVVSNNDGNLRGVRYTADGTINPKVIYDALMKFLSL